MSLKRILGTMLASRMAGRGRRRGGLAGAAMGGLGRRRSGMGGKLGLAAMGYMAYKAYQDSQSGKQGTTRAGSSSGGLAGLVQQVTGKVKEATGTTEPEPDLTEDQRAADSLSDDKALLLIRAMITAAYSDGAMSQRERATIMGEIEQSGGDAEDRAVMEREIANPKPLDELLVQVNDHETAQEFYLASSAAVDGESEANRAYLAELRRRLELTDEEVAEIDEMAA